jgi:hypothetical protein
MSFGDRLRESANGDGDFDPPDGPHQVRIVDGDAFVSEKGNEIAKVTLQVVGGENNGRSFDHIMAFTKQATKWSTESLLAYGVNLDKIDEFDDLKRELFDLIGNVANVTVRHRNGYLNVSVQGSRTGESDVTPKQEPLPTAAAPNGADGNPFAAPAAPKSGTSDDDIPF